MTRTNPSEEDEEKSQENLDFKWDVAKNRETGIYEIKTESHAAQSQNEPTTVNILSHVPVDIKRDILAIFLTATAVVISVVTLAVLALYTSYTRGQWQQMIRAAGATENAADAANRSAGIANDSLTKLNRAFVFLSKEFNVTGGSQWSIFPSWENSGITPTKNFRTHISWNFFLNPLPKDFDFADHWQQGEEHKILHAVVGPKGVVIFDIGPIDQFFIEQVYAKKGYIYFWGWAKYGDVFEGTPEHVTKFCLQFIPEGPLVSSGPNTQHTFRLVNCDTHNCYDEECKQ